MAKKAAGWNKASGEATRVDVKEVVAVGADPRRASVDGGGMV